MRSAPSLKEEGSGSILQLMKKNLILCKPYYMLILKEHN